MTRRDGSTNESGVTRRQLATLLAAGAATAGLPRVGAAQSAAPTAATVPAEPQRGGILKVAAANNPSTLDPMTGRSGFDQPLLYPMFDTLIEFTYDSLAAKAGLAKSWTFKDPKTLVLVLNDGIRFHDGTPCDAEAVKFNLDRSRTDPRSAIKTDLISVDSVAATGPLEVTLHLKQPDTSLVLVLSDRAGMMVSPKAARELGAGTDRNPVGAGPWKFVSWTDNDSLVVTRNTDYWRSGRPYLDGIRFQIIPELNTGLRSVVSGENQFVYSLSRQQERIIQRSPNLVTTATPTLIVHMIYFNMGRKPFDDVRVRQALNYATDREAFNALTQDGRAARSVLPQEHWAYNPSLEKAYPYDPDRARRLLAEAGYPQGFELSAMGWNDQKAVQRQEILIEQFGKVGVKTRFTTASVADSTNQFMMDRHGDAYLGAFTGRPDPSLIFSRLFDPNSVINAGRVDPVAARAAAQQATVESDDQAVRKQALATLQQIVSDNALCLPITIQFDVTAFDKTVSGYLPNLTGKPKLENVFLA